MSGHHDGQELVRRLARQRLVAATAVIAVATVNYRGATRTARLTRLVVTLVLVVLAVVVVACLGGGQADLGRLTPLLGEHGRHGILQSAGLLFFAFAGYARIATMGEEVRDPGRTIPRAIQWALAGAVLAGAVAVYLAIAVRPCGGGVGV